MVDSLLHVCYVDLEEFILSPNMKGRCDKLFHGNVEFLLKIIKLLYMLLLDLKASCLKKHVLSTCV